jgi:phosphate transport system protein
MERQFDQQLSKLRKRLLKMCSLIEEQVDFALKSIEEDNHEYIDLVAEREDKVDKFDLKIEKICMKIFALNQPVAMDLRLIMSALTINTNLERIGDIALNITQYYKRLSEKPKFLDRTPFYEMAKVAREMLKDSINSFIHNDAQLARKVIATDSILDDHNRTSYQVLKEIMKESTDNIDPGVAFLVISRQLERLGDHATNIAEDVYFIVEAQMVKHKYEKYLFGGDDDEEDED